MKSNKKGFTIVEIVIALTIISIVSLTATSLVMVSQRISKSTRDQFLAVNLCNNSIAVFQSASSMENGSFDTFYNSYKVCFSNALKIDENIFLEEDKQENNITAAIYLDSSWNFLNAKDNAKIKCELNFNTNNNEFITLNVTVYYVSADSIKEQLYDATYSMSLTEAL